MDFSACSIRGGGSGGKVELIFPRRKLKSNRHGRPMWVWPGADYGVARAYTNP